MTRSLRVAIAGHVDHGKSTLIGRLMADTGQIRPDRESKVRAQCESSGKKFEFAFLLDALEEEQQQGITIDVTEVRWLHRDREYVLIDTPGHREFLKNMVGGATKADAAVLMIDAVEGIKAHFQRQVAVMNLLNIPRTIVVINKMDLVGWEQKVFTDRSAQVEELFRKVGLRPPQILPVAAFLGANVVHRAPEMSWYKGPTFAEALADLPPAFDRAEAPLRFPVQDVYKFDERRIYVGRVESGRLCPGQRLRFAPGGRESTVLTVEAGQAESGRPAEPGDAVGITLTDPIFVERGDLAHEPSHPPRVSRALSGDLFWLSANPLVEGGRYGFRCGTMEATARVEAIESVLDTDTLENRPAESIEPGGMGRIRLSLDKPVAHDFFGELPHTGRFVLVDDHRVAGGGRVLADQRAYLSVEQSRVPASDRVSRLGHPGFVIWMVGLSGAGKSTIAKELEVELFRRGYVPFILDGDNIRQGICRDLGFSESDRSENIRRVAEVAKLFADAGLATITAFISPFQSDRERAREVIGPDRFVEVFVDCPIEVCESRDPKKLYSQARRGQVADFTGLTSPFEPPVDPRLRLDTSAVTVTEAATRILDLIAEQYPIKDRVRS